MTHWIHTETPFGNAVYQISQTDENMPTIVLHGVGTLTAEQVLKADYQGDTVPDWDAMKAEARRIADEAGAPLAAWYAPNPALTVNGKSYTDMIWAEFRNDYNGDLYVSFRLGELTDAAQRKFGAWLMENRAALMGGENGRASAIASATDALRWAERELDDARDAEAKAKAARDDAAAALHKAERGE